MLCIDDFRQCLDIRLNNKINRTNRYLNRITHVAEIFIDTNKNRDILRNTERAIFLYRKINSFENKSFYISISLTLETKILKCNICDTIFAFYTYHVIFSLKLCRLGDAEQNRYNSENITGWDKRKTFHF